MGNCCGQQPNTTEEEFFLRSPEIMLSPEPLKQAKVVKAEQCVMKMRAKIYRFRDNQWEERGVGNAKLMRNNIEKSISFLMRE